MRLFFGKVPRTIGPCVVVAMATVSSLAAQTAPMATGARAQPMGARVLALGGLDVALADPEAVAANPALLLAARGLAFSAQTQHRAGGAGAAAMVTAVGPVTFGLVARHAAPRDRGPQLGRPDWSDDVLEAHRDDGAATTALTVSAARVIKGQRVGVGVTYANDGSAITPGTLALDLGYQRPLFMGLLGVSVTALDPTGEHLHVGGGPRSVQGHTASHDSMGPDGHDHGMAPDVRLAAGWFGSKAIAAAWDVGGGVQTTLWGNGDFQPVGAAELSYVPIQGVSLTVRSGVRVPRGDREGLVTGGVGASLDHLSLDYAIAPGRNGDASVHRVGVRVR